MALWHSAVAWTHSTGVLTHPSGSDTQTCHGILTQPCGSDTLLHVMAWHTPTCHGMLTHHSGSDTLLYFMALWHSVAASVKFGHTHLTHSTGVLHTSMTKLRSPRHSPVTSLNINIVSVQLMNNTVCDTLDSGQSVYTCTMGIECKSTHREKIHLIFNIHIYIYNHQGIFKQKHLKNMTTTAKRTEKQQAKIYPKSQNVWLFWVGTKFSTLLFDFHEQMQVNIIYNDKSEV